MKPFALGLLLCATVTQSFALTCPSIAQIQTGEIQPWTALDVNDDEPASPVAFHYFQGHVRQFYHAEWLPGVPYDSQCYYRLTDDNDAAEVSLSMTRGKEPTGENWHFVASNTRKVCDSADTNACRFD